VHGMVKLTTSGQAAWAQCTPGKRWVKDLQLETNHRSHMDALQQVRQEPFECWAPTGHANNVPLQYTGEAS
jgi:hypothetical protein